MGNSNKAKGMVDPAEAYKKGGTKKPAKRGIPKGTGQPKEVFNFVKSNVHMERHKMDNKPMGDMVKMSGNGKGFGKKKGQ